MEESYPHVQLAEVTIAELQAALQDGHLTSLQLVNMYLQRIQAINRQGPCINALAEINPDARTIAQQLDQERKERGPRGPLHGIPLLLKDNIATTDRMETTAGSLALVGIRPKREAFVVQQLRAAGAIILGKANLSEWANFRSSHSSSGWSGRGGQVLNPYVLNRTPCGSSSGSATAVAAGLAAASLGTETDGSILCPANMNAVVGIKPTVGLTSRSGVIPIAHSQDTVGPFGRTVADAAAVLGALVGVDERDTATQQSTGKIYHDYTQFLDDNGLRGARIGIAREVYSGYDARVDALLEQAIAAMRTAGAEIIDPANIPTAKQINETDTEMTVLLYEFKADLNSYLQDLAESPVRSLADVIAFNTAHTEQEMPYFQQELLLNAQEAGTLADERYLAALEKNQRLARQEGIDAVMEQYHLDALVMPTGGPAWLVDLVNGDHGAGGCSQPAALAGYPAISVPMGYIFELPIGITFMGRAFSEPTLIKLAYAFEQRTKARHSPKYLQSVP